MNNFVIKVIAAGFVFSNFGAVQADVYTLDRASGQLYKVDPADFSVQAIGAPIGPYGGQNFLSGLPRHEYNNYKNIDITYLDGFLYGLAANTWPASGGANNAAILFRLDLLGVVDASFGTNGYKTLSILGETPFDGTAEGIASNGTNLLIVHSALNDTASFSHIISEYDVTADAIISSVPIENMTGAPPNTILTDADGLGAWNGHAMSVDVRPVTLFDGSAIVDLGQLTNGNFNEIYSVADGYFADVAYISEYSFVVAGDYNVPDSSPSGSTSKNGLHFFSNIGGVTTYVDTVQLVNPSSNNVEMGIYAVASTTENQQVVVTDPVIVPDPIKPSNYLCYDLLEHEREKMYEEGRIVVTDQFYKTDVRLGHPVSLCNPVDIRGEKKSRRKRTLCLLFSCGNGENITRIGRNRKRAGALAINHRINGSLVFGKYKRTSRYTGV